ncbi:MAG: hypothetical protein IBJ00_01355 [Alphaproteobacteria bacterium]|nr:hypothetical protein [Alphaproteobacteria bacterium]
MNKFILGVAIGFYLFLLPILQPSFACNPEWNKLPKEIWREFFEELDFKPETVIILPQINFKFKQLLAKFLYKKDYKEKWIQAARNISDARLFLKCIDQHLRSDLGSLKAHLSFARIAEVQFHWKSHYMVSQESYLQGKYLFIKHYAFAAAKGNHEARAHLKWLLDLPIDNPDSPFAWLNHALIKKHRLKTAPHTPSDIQALVQKEGNELENEILLLLKKYAS